MSTDKNAYYIYTDTGGTFTDCVIVSGDGRVYKGKSSTTPSDLEECFFKSVDAAVAAAEGAISGDRLFPDTRVVGYGTTQGTNVVITGTGAPNLGFITTRGHEDRTLIGRLRAAGLSPVEGMHIVSADKPAPLVPRTRIRGVGERVDCFGEALVPLNEDEVRAAVKDLVENENVEGIAVGFLWSFLEPKHEKRVREIINELYPDLPVALSHEVNPVLREEPRFRTTQIDLYIGRALRSLLERIEKSLYGRGYRYPLLVLQAGGGVSRAAIVKPANTLHSGPVGGLMGVEYLKRVYGLDNAMGSDVGGTSFDITVSPKKGPEYMREPLVGRFQISNPMLEIVTIGAGGGTIARVDSITGVLRVGPDSAGADPGPVAYGRGGTEPTVTDADIVLKRIDPEYFLGGNMTVDADKAHRAVEEKIARPLGLNVEEAARSIVQIVDATMASALRTTLAARGLDPAQFALIAFGGGGPSHCAGYSEGIGFREVIVPEAAAVFSAFGASTAPVRHRHEGSPFVVLPPLPFDQVSLEFDARSLSIENVPGWARERLNKMVAALEQAAREDMYAEGLEDGQFQIRYEMLARYGGQLWEVRVSTPTIRIESTDDLIQVISAFEQEYIRTYTRGAMVPAGGMEIVTVAVEALAEPVHAEIRSYESVGRSPRQAQKGTRRVYWRDGFVDTPIYEWSELGSGNEMQGPAIVESRTTTFVIPIGRDVVVDQHHNMRMTLSA
ncbi:MAG: hydantoinase/oxoprolinase family protein [Thermoleophilia bacterium]